MVSLMEQGGSKWSKLVKQLDGKKEGSDEENEESPKVAAKKISFLLFYLLTLRHCLVVVVLSNSRETEHRRFKSISGI